jgi:hypothetical protein
MLHFRRLFTAASIGLLWLGTESFTILGQTSSNPQPPVSLTQAEKDAGWWLLFDGRNPGQWRGFGQPDFPTNRWNVENGCLHLKPHVGGGDLLPCVMICSRSNPPAGRSLAPAAQANSSEGHSRRRISIGLG